MNMSQMTRAAGYLLTACAVVSTSCTFYTACPTGNGNANTNGGATANGGGNGGANSPTKIMDGKIPPGKWLNVMPDLGDQEDRCGPIFLLSAYPGRDEVIAGAFYGLLSTRDGGNTWAPLGQGEGSFMPNNRAAAFVYDVADADTYWEAGIYGDGVVKTLDGGDTFAKVGDLQHVESFAVDMTDSKRGAMLATGHEVQLLQRSFDAGETWEDITDTLPPGLRWCRFAAILETTTFLLGCGGGPADGLPATLISRDAGDTWTQVFDDGGGAPPLLHSDGSIYWPTDSAHGLAFSADRGATWEARPAPDLLSVQPVELPDGRIASLTGDRVVVSDDGGVTWLNVTPKTPWRPSSFTYSPFQKAFFISYFACYGEPTKAKGDEIMRFDFDFKKY